MTSTEKSILGLLLIMALTIVGAVGLVVAAIDSHGGVKQIVIDTGKDIKDIAREIAEDE